MKVFYFLRRKRRPRYQTVSWDTQKEIRERRFNPLWSGQKRRVWFVHVPFALTKFSNHPMAADSVVASTMLAQNLVHRNTPPLH